MHNRFAAVQFYLLVVFLRAIVGECAGAGAQNVVLCIEWVVVAQSQNFDVIIYHVAHCQCIRVLVNGSGLCGGVLIYIVISPVCTILLNRCIGGAEHTIGRIIVVLLQDVLDAQQGVGDGGIAVITAGIALCAVAQNREQVQHLCIHDGTGVGNAAQPQRIVVVDAAEVRLFCSVETAVVVLQFLADCPAGLDELLIGCPAGVCHFLVDVLHGVSCIVNGFAADAENGGDADAETNPFLSSFQALPHEVDGNDVDADQCGRNPDAILGKLIVSLCIDVEEDCQNAQQASAQRQILDAVQFGEGCCCHGNQDKGNQEGVTEREPVWYLSAVPHNVNRYHINTGNHSTQQQGITNLLADFNFLVAVEQREQNHGKQTAVNFRFALYVYRVILCRQQLRQQIDQIEAVLDTPGHIRFGEVEFTKLQGAVNRQ